MRRQQVKAYHKYKLAAKRGNKEAQRRIAQSMGYKYSIYDMPDMIKLLYRAGIEIQGVDYEDTNTFVGDPVADKEHVADTTTLKL